MTTVDVPALVAQPIVEARPPEWLVAPEVAEEWAALSFALASMAPGLPACATSADPEAWWSPGSSKRAAAAVEACSSCRARVACAAFAIANGEREGVWGATTPADRGLGRRGKRVGS